MAEDTIISMLWNIASMFVGMIITFYAARYYYDKAAGDMHKQTKVLLQWNRVLLRQLQNDPGVSVEWDKDGNPVNVVFGAGVLMSSEATIRGKGTVSRGETDLTSEDQSDSSDAEE